MWIRKKCYEGTAAKIGHQLMFIERNRGLFPKDLRLNF